MIHTYTIIGMTCSGCQASVKKYLSQVDGVENVEVNLEAGTAQISMQRPIETTVLRAALPQKYTIPDTTSEKGMVPQGVSLEKAKLKQLRPLLLIFLYLFSAAILLNLRDWSVSEAMLDFMGLFYIVFSFFKFLDFKGFPKSFSMYDPLAKTVPGYGWVYPFLELGLGLLFLMRFKLIIALVVTLVVLGITTVGVAQSLLDRKQIRCACLGTALKLPMTEATLVENAIMLVMAGAMLFQLI
ncbi:MAG: MauE/DoxX family redox-associated membrane protein [Bacteroidota bacterium]